MTENADLQSRVVELQSRHQVKDSVLVYAFCGSIHLCDGSAHSSRCVVNGIIISVLQSVEREFQSLVSVVQTKDRGLAEAQQQLRQKVNS